MSSLASHTAKRVSPKKALSNTSIVLLTSALSKTSRMLPNHTMPKTNGEELKQAGCRVEIDGPVVEKLNTGIADSGQARLCAGNGRPR